MGLGFTLGLVRVLGWGVLYTRKKGNSLKALGNERFA